jgi:hypothetical protein
MDKDDKPFLSIPSLFHSVSRFFFNKASGKCQNFIFGGCGANRNNFLQLTDCESTCSTHLRKVSILPYANPGNKSYEFESSENLS